MRETRDKRLRKKEKEMREKERENENEKEKSEKSARKHKQETEGKEEINNERKRKRTRDDFRLSVINRCSLELQTQCRECIVDDRARGGPEEGIDEERESVESEESDGGCGWG